jgi:hypothetical protein
MSEEQRTLQQRLAITPKTAALLIRLGYHDYRDLKDSSPSQIVTQLQQLPDVTKSQAETYRRAARRMVWLATQENPAEKAKTCSDWGQKGLKARGIWCDDFDDLTGLAINELMA